MTRHDIWWRHPAADSGTSGGRHTVTSQLTVAGYPVNCGFKLFNILLAALPPRRLRDPYWMRLNVRHEGAL